MESLDIERLYGGSCVSVTEVNSDSNLMDCCPSIIVTVTQYLGIGVIYSFYAGVAIFLGVCSFLLG